MIKWPVKLYVRFFTFFYVFFKIPKNMTFYVFFELLHTFSRTVIQTAEDIVKLLSGPGSPIIIVCFDPKRRYPVPNRTVSAGRKIHGVGEFCDFE